MKAYLISGLLVGGIFFSDAAPVAAQESLPIAPKKLSNNVITSRQEPVSDVEFAKTKKYLKELRDARKALADERTAMEQLITPAGSSIGSRKLTKLRLHVLGLLTKVAARPRRHSQVDTYAPPAISTPPVQKESPTKSKKQSGPTSPSAKVPENPKTPNSAAAPVPSVLSDKSIVAPLDLANSYFLQHRYDAALNMYNRLDLSGLRKEDEMTIRYMAALCLRRLGKKSEANKAFTKIIEANPGPVLSHNAQWQLDSMTWRQDMEGRLQALRKKITSFQKQQ